MCVGSGDFKFLLISPLNRQDFGGLDYTPKMTLMEEGVMNQKLPFRRGYYEIGT